MAVTELRCPGCSAPLGPTADASQVCRVAVLLEHTGSRKLAVIAALREHVDLGVAEARRLVEGAPCVLVASLGGQKARALLASLESAGATARLEAVP